MGVLESKPTLPPQDLAYLTRHTHCMVPIFVCIEKALCWLWQVTQVWRTVNEAEVRVLFERFRAVSASIQKDDTIEFNEFQAGTVSPLPWVQTYACCVGVTLTLSFSHSPYVLVALGRHDRVFTKRFFTIFDSDGNNEIDFRCSSSCC